MQRLGTIPVYTKPRDKRVIKWLEKQVNIHDLHTGHTLPKGEYVNPTKTRGWLSALNDYISENGIRTVAAEFATFSLFIFSLWGLHSFISLIWGA